MSINTIIFSFFTFFGLCGLLSCSTSSNVNKMNTYKINDLVADYTDKTTDKQDVDFMKKLLKNEIDFWIENYSSMGFYKEEDFIISDIMIFSKNKDKALLFVYSLLSESNDGEGKLISAKLNKNDKWEFRYSGLPTFYYEYDEELRKGNKFTENEILVRTIDHIIEDGLINTFGHISQDYIQTKWF